MGLRSLPVGGPHIHTSHWVPYSPRLRPPNQHSLRKGKRGTRGLGRAGPGRPEQRVEVNTSFHPPTLASPSWLHGFGLTATDAPHQRGVCLPSASLLIPRSQRERFQLEQGTCRTQARKTRALCVAGGCSRFFSAFLTTALIICFASIFLLLLPLRLQNKTGKPGK